MAFQGAIFDVDGVIVDSPHELAWREALKELLEGEWRDIRDRTSWTAERFTTQVYQQVVAGKPRMAGARAALEYFGVPDVGRRIEQYAAAKHQHVLQFIEQGRFRAFPDALRFILAVKKSGIRVAAASSSKNAKLFLERIRLDTFTAEQRLDYGFVRPEMTLEELFDADISGRDLARGKPRPPDLPDRGGGARAFPGGVFRRRGCDKWSAGGQGRRICRHRRRPAWRPSAAGRCGRRPGRDHSGRRIPSRARQWPIEGRPGRRGDPAAIR